MSDPLRSDRDSGPEGAPNRDREGQVEELLVSGLDHYFAGRYDLAINVWTRVLFLDRGHARARAYIERARGAIGERQREGDELLYTGAAAFNRGDTDAARRLLTSAVERGASSEAALAMLERLDRLEAARPEPVDAAAVAKESPAGGGGRRVAEPARVVDAVATRRSRLAWVAAGVAFGVALGVLAGLAVWAGSAKWLPWQGPSVSIARSYAAEPLPVPAASEVWMSRGCGLYAKGRLHEALAAFEAIRPGDPLRADADVARATIQRQLLAAAQGSDPGASADALLSCKDLRR